MSRRERRGKRFDFDLDDLEDLGEVLEDKIEGWADAIEGWADRQEKGGDTMTRSERRGAAEGGLTSEEAIRRRVEKRHKERNDLRIHLVMFLMVNVLLWFIWLISGGGFAWPLFVTFGWGIGIVAHYLDYNYQYGRPAERREQEIQRELERARRAGQLADHEPRKRKHEDLEPVDDAYVRLSDDGELVEWSGDELEDGDAPQRTLRD
jgi:hypothetical protein